MSDTSQPTQPNEPEARTPTGELKDQQTPPTKTEGTQPDPSKTTPTDTKADDKDKSLLNQGDKKPEDKPAAPETYADFKAPEGFEIDKDAIAEALPIFKELGLTQDQAQSLVDFYAKTSQKAANAPVDYWKAQQETWRNEIKADPVIGGRLDQVRAETSRMVDSVGEPKLAADFREAMDLTGAGNNPAFIRFFHAMAKKFGEGTLVSGSGPTKQGQAAPGAAPKSVASALYPNLPE